MLKKIQKLEKCLISLGIEYDFSISYDSRSNLEEHVLKWELDGTRNVFTEDEEGYTKLTVSNPHISIEGKEIF